MSAVPSTPAPVNANMAAAGTRAKRDQATDQLNIETRARAQLMYSLGTMCRTGKGVPVDGGEAIKWFRAAATAGHADAMLALGEMYADGAGIPANGAEALE